MVSQTNHSSLVPEPLPSKKNSWNEQGSQEAGKEQTIRANQKGSIRKIVKFQSGSLIVDRY